MILFRPIMLLSLFAIQVVHACAHAKTAQVLSFCPVRNSVARTYQEAAEKFQRQVSQEKALSVFKSTILRNVFKKRENEFKRREKEQLKEIEILKSFIIEEHKKLTELMKAQAKCDAAMKARSKKMSKYRQGLVEAVQGYDSQVKYSEYYLKHNS